MRKFDFQNWSEFDGKADIEVGSLHVRSSQACNFYVEGIDADGVAREVLAGTGFECALEIGALEGFAFRVRCDAPKGTRFFRHVPHRAAHKPDTPKFTNTDRKPQESGSVLEVRKALREFEYQKRRGLAELRAAAAAVQPAKPDEGAEGKPDAKQEAKPEAKPDEGAERKAEATQ